MSPVTIIKRCILVMSQFFRKLAKPRSNSTGTSFNSGENQVEWQGNNAGETEVVIRFDPIVAPRLSDFTIIKTTATLTRDGQVHKLPALTAVNGMHAYFPYLPSL